MTTQPYIQAANKKGLAPIYVRYFHNTVFFTVPVKHSIPVEFWDPKKRSPKIGYPEKLKIDIKISEIETLMMRVARNFMQQGIDPSRELVKAGYLEEQLKEKSQSKAKQVTQPIATEPTQPSDPYAHLNFDEFGQPQEYVQDFVSSPNLCPHGDGNDLLRAQQELSNFDEIEHAVLLDKVLALVNGQFVKLAKEWIAFDIKNKPATRYKRNSWLTTIQEFSKSTLSDLNIPYLNNDFYKRYVTWLSEEKKFKDNTVGSHIKTLRTFLGFLQDEHGDQVMVKRNFKRVFKVLKDEKDVVYLTPEEVDLVYQYRGQSFTEKPIYDKVIDMCVFMCLTSLRISDCKQTERFKVENGILTGKMFKTGGRFRIPLALDNRILEILERNNFDMNLMSDKEYNLQIKNLLKEIFRKHKINQKPIKVTHTRMGIPVTENKFKWEVITSHSNRRSFATNLSNKGWSIEDIAYLMGSASFDELKKYISNKDSDLKLKVVNMNKISEIKNRIKTEN